MTTRMTKHLDHNNDKNGHNSNSHNNNNDNSDNVKTACYHSDGHIHGRGEGVQKDVRDAHDQD